MNTQSSAWVTNVHLDEGLPGEPLSVTAAPGGREHPAPQAPILVWMLPLKGQHGFDRGSADEHFWPPP